MWSLLLLAVVTQAPSGEGVPAAAPPASPPATAEIAVVFSVRQGALSEAVAAKLEAVVRAELEGQGLAVQRAEVTQARLEPRVPAECESNRACYALLGVSAGTPWIVRIEGTMVEADVAVFLQALSTVDGSIAAEHSFVTTAAAIDGALGPLVRPLAERLKTATVASDPFAAASRADSPVRTELVPSSTAGGHSQPGEVVFTRSSNRGPAYVAAGGAVVATGIAAVFTAMGASARSCLDGPELDGQPTVCVPQSQAGALAREANANFTVGAISGAAALALTGAATYLFLSQ